MSEQMKFRFFAHNGPVTLDELEDAMEDFVLEWGRNAILEAFPNYGPGPKDIQTEEQAEFVARTMMDDGRFERILPPEED